MLSQQDHNAGEVAALSLSRTIHRINKADAPTEFIADFEAGLSRTLFKEYEATAEDALSSALKAYKGKSTAAQVKSIEAALSNQFAGFGKGLESTVNKLIDIFYKEQVSEFIKEFGLIKKAAIPEGEIGIDFSLQDSQAIAATELITVQSAGRYFPEQLMEKTSEVIRRIVLESGLPPEEAAKVLESELKGALGLEFSAAIPPQFRTNPSAYFDIVATNASVQATSVGRMIAMDDAGVQKFRIVAILDRRTSAICRGLDGKEFSVKTAMTAVGSFLEVQSIADLENIMGFSKTDSAPDWAASGQGFPPFHHGCRTTVVPIV